MGDDKAVPEGANFGDGEETETDESDAVQKKRGKDFSEDKLSGIATALFLGLIKTRGS